MIRQVAVLSPAVQERTALTIDGRTRLPDSFGARSSTIACRSPHRTWVIRFVPSSGSTRTRELGRPRDACRPGPKQRGRKRAERRNRRECWWCRVTRLSVGRYRRLRSRRLMARREACPWRRCLSSKKHLRTRVPDVASRMGLEQEDLGGEITVGVGAADTGERAPLQDSLHL